MQDLTARELMTTPVKTIAPEITIAQALGCLLRYGHSGFPVLNQDQLIGMVSRRDLEIAAHYGLSDAPAQNLITPAFTIAPETPLSEIQSILATQNIKQLLVIEVDRVIGIVTQGDLRSLQSVSPIQNLLKLNRFAAPFQRILTIAAQHAEQRGWHLYLVGGAVRDLLLADPNSPVMLSDIDLVVDGFHQAADVGAGVELARSLQSSYPEARLEIHGKFQTAALLWQSDPELDSLWIDIATARTEFYPYPAANPEVESSSIRQDLYRRDFTINALAWRLTQSSELLDFFNGVRDLNAKQIRVLHVNSFVEDPTRIYRAVRFAVRLGFELEPQTDRLIRLAIASGVYERVRLEHAVVPALQTRLRSELKYILQAPYWKAALGKLWDLGALSCIDPKLELSAAWRPLKLLDRALRRFDSQQSIAHWQMLLETMIAPLENRVLVAENLQLPIDAIERLKHLTEIEASLDPLPSSPSQTVRLLKAYDLQTLILVGVRSSRSSRRSIWRYLTVWSLVKAPLDGTDLKTLGYKPGRQFKQMLDDLLAASLDGKIQNQSDAEQFLAQHYPLN